MRQRLAVIGSGIAGLGAALVLGRAYDVDLFEAGSHFGGHVHTHDLRVEERDLAVDSGFIVFNELNYPNFVRLLQQLGVAARPTSMSFSVKDERSGLEYNGSSLNQLFARRRNLFSLRFHRMLREILRFNAEGRAVARAGAMAELSLGEFLRAGAYSKAFVDWYIVPMGSALWSADPVRLLDFPVLTFLRFFDHHRMLDVKGRPQWLTVTGGSREYVRALLAAFSGRAFLASPVAGVRRLESGVELQFADQPARRYDQVVLAVHSDQALRLLQDPSPAERELLGAVGYQANPVLLHTDASLLPKRRLAWGAWNSRLPREPRRAATVTYWMNGLQGLEVQTPLLVSLNSAEAVDPARVLKQLDYQHPVFTREAVAARDLLPALNGTRRTWFCGAWCGNGFHEDGLASALAVCRRFGLEL
ncbi:MAG: FAD-dependent oxidoreductase [Candidatus Delongbacteria bacterium]